MMFGEVKKEPKIIEKFKVTKIPTLMVITDPEAHTGETFDMKDIKID